MDSDDSTMESITFFAKLGQSILSAGRAIYMFQTCGHCSFVRKAITRLIVVVNSVQALDRIHRAVSSFAPRLSTAPCQEFHVLFVLLEALFTDSFCIMYRACIGCIALRQTSESSRVLKVLLSSVMNDIADADIG